MKNVIFFGPPGAGKGTQAKLLSEKFKISHLSTGDILRSKISDSDELSNQLKNLMSKGLLVPDNILNEIVSSKLENEKKGFILDGYPRTLDQAKFINSFFEDNNINIELVFDIALDFSQLEKRIINRSKIENREDDNLEIIKVRYEAYVESTQIVSDFYKQNFSNIYHKLDGNQEIEQIQSKIEKIYKN